MQNVTGNIELTVQLETTGPAVVTLRQLPLKEYERAFALIDDEIALAALIAGKDKRWALELAPDSYEEVREKGWELNKGFFAYADRTNEALMKKLNSLKPSTLSAAADIAKNASRPLSPASLPRPV